MTKSYRRYRRRITILACFVIISWMGLCVRLFQIQVLNADVEAISQINARSNEIIELANSSSNTLPKLGKGAKKVECKEITSKNSSMLIVELMIDVGDAMGANVTNTMCETVAPLIEKISGGKTLLRLSLIHI